MPAAVEPGGPLAELGLYGKVPAHGDFVRLRAAEPLPRALVLWLEEGSETAKQQGAPCGPEPVRFLFRPGPDERALVGALAGSTDKVGRRFPLAVFATASGTELQARFPALDGAARPFFEGVEAALCEAANLDGPQLSARVELLPRLSPGALETEHTVLRERAAQESVRQTLTALFGDWAAGQHLYAAHCVRSACASARPVVLDCPVRNELDVWAWLEAIRRLQKSAMPSMFWRLGPAPRLLVSVGPPPPSIFGLLWDATRRDGKLWPLTTPQPAAIDVARRALGPAALRVIERPDASLLDFVSAISGEE